MGLKAKRRKVECCECGKVFDSDYQKRHEAADHGGAHVKIKDFGASANPFILAAERGKVSVLLLVDYTL